MCSQRVDVWGRDLGDETGVFQRLQATERMPRMICGATLKDMVESDCIKSVSGQSRKD